MKQGTGAELPQSAARNCLFLNCLVVKELHAGGTGLVAFVELIRRLDTNNQLSDCYFWVKTVVDVDLLSGQ